MSCISAALSCLPRLSIGARKPRPIRACFGLLLLAASLLAHAQTPQTNLTTNLLTNPGAEDGTIAGWTPAGSGPPSTDNGTLDPGINPHTGTYDFDGFYGPADSLSQTVSLVTQGVTPAMLDSRAVYANLSFWEQGLNQGSLSDDAFITLTFLDATGATLKITNSGEVDSHNNTWQNFTQRYRVPPGTRSITYTMNFLRHVGGYLDAYVDDNSLILSTGGLALTQNNLDFGNQPVGTTSPAQTVTLTNPATTPVNIAKIILDLGASPSDFTQTNTCPAALAPSATCTISIVFNPHGVGTKTAGLDIQDDSTPGEQGINVTGVGTGGILQVNPGNLKTIAGNGTPGLTGDGGAAPLAELNIPGGIAFDPQGNLYIADTPNNVVRKVDVDGIITTFAGTGTGGFAGDNGPATSALLSLPFGVAVDSAGNVFIQDTGNSLIRKVDLNGIITTFAGTGSNGNSGDGGPATQATFNQNQGARFDQAGNFFVPQCQNASIRKITPAGIISTVAGTGTNGFSGDNGPATSAQLDCPSGAVTDPAGNLYIADEFNQRIRKVDTSGKITTIAGGAAAGATGDGGPAASALLNLPNDVAIDAAGNLYITDSGNNRIRKIDTQGIITTVAGGLQNAGSAGVNSPLNLTIDSNGNLFFSDSGNNAIRELFPAGTTPFPATPVGTAAAPQTLTLSNIGNLPVTIASSASFTLGGNASDFALIGGTCLAGANLSGNQSSCTLQVSFTPTAAGVRTLNVSVADDALNTPQSFVISGTGTAIAPTITWNPLTPIPFGTPLSAAQLDAVATGFGGGPVTGTFVYTPAAGTVLGLGQHTLAVTFTSNDPSYTATTATASITVTQATPTISWATPAPIPYGTPLSAAQLNATATAVDGSPLPGTLTYTPSAGTLLAPGTQTLTVTFAPQDAGSYLTANATVALVVTGPAISALSPAVGRQGGPDTPVTITGSGFVSTSVVQVNGSTVATTVVSPTTLTTVFPAALLAKPAALQVTVLDPTVSAVSPPQVFTVVPNTPNVTVTGPSTTPPGSQPSLTLTIVNPYPVDLTATFNLSFLGASTPPVDDPAIQFAAGGRTLTFTVPANTTATPPIQLQAGTVAGTITVPVTFTANGLDVTPANLAPVVIVIPAAVPVISTAAVTRSGSQLSVAIHGFSNTREVTVATFHFTAASGDSVSTPDITAQVGTLFTTWYTGTQSPAYGSSFTYTQIFNVSDDAAHVGSVVVTLTNSVGASQPATAP